MLEPNTSGDFSETFVKIWLLENQKNTVFSHFEKKKTNWLNLARKKRLQIESCKIIFLKNS